MDYLIFYCDRYVVKLEGFEGRGKGVRNGYGVILGLLGGYSVRGLGYLFVDVDSCKLFFNVFVDVEGCRVCFF